MAIGESAGLLFRIKGDSTDAVKAIKDVQEAEDGLAGSTGKLAGAMALGTSAGQILTATLTAVVDIALRTATGIFDLSNSAADFGAEIFDASEKTGLTTEALSAMKFAADQSGTSLEAITSSASKFARTLNEAANGSESAQAKLKALGITSSDLDVALAQAFATIAKMEPGTKQMAAAMDLFGKSGAQLIPFIKSFDGDLEALIGKFKDLGLTIDKETASAADEFGDTLDTVNAQLAGLGKQIGNQFIPIITDAMSYISRLLATHKDDITGITAGWVQAFVKLEYVVTDFVSRYAAALERNNTTTEQWVQRQLDLTGSLLIRYSQLARIMGGVASDGIGKATGFGPPAEGVGGGPGFGSIRTGGGGGGGRSSGADKAEREAERAAERERSASLQLALNEFKSSREVFEQEMTAAREKFSETDDLDAYFQRLEEIENKYKSLFETQLANIRDLEIAQLRAGASQAERDVVALKTTERIDDLKKKGLEEYKKTQEEINKSEQREFDRGMSNAERRLEAIRKEIRLREQLADPGLMAPVPSSQPQVEPETKEPYSLKSGVMSGLGIDLVPMFDEATGAMVSFQDRMNDVRGDVNSFIGESIGGMVQGLSQMATAWLVTGDFSAKAALSMLAGVALSIATQAGLKAIFEYAEGTAALAATWGVPNPKSIAHFAAAGLYTTVAAVAGGAGVGLALGARAMGGGSKAFSASTRGGGSYATGVEEERKTISRESEGAYGSGNPFQQMNAMLQNMFQPAADRFNDATDKFVAHVGTITAGDALIRGISERPGLVGKTVVEDVGRNSRIGSDLHRSMGGR